MPNISLHVDLIPLILMAAAGLSATLLISNIRGQDSNRNVTLIALSGLAGACGLWLIFARGQVPDWVSILPGNLLVIASYVALCAATARTAGHSFLPLLILGLFASGAFTLAFAMDPGALQLRVVIMSLTLAAFAAVMVVALMPLRRKPAIAAVIAIVGVAAALGLLRALAAAGMLSASDEVDALTLRLGVLASLGAAVVLTWLSWRARMVPGEPAHLVDEDATFSWRLATERRALVAPTGLEVRLTGNEYLVLQKLSSGGEPVARNDLNAVIGRDAENPKDRGVDILISRLRRKCGDAGLDLPIVSVRGRGYVFHGELAIA